MKQKEERQKNKTSKFFLASRQHFFGKVNWNRLFRFGKITTNQESVFFLFFFKREILFLHLGGKQIKKVVVVVVFCSRMKHFFLRETELKQT